MVMCCRLGSNEVEDVIRFLFEPRVMPGLFLLVRDKG